MPRVSFSDHIRYNHFTMKRLLTRRDFLKIAAASLGGLAFRPFFTRWDSFESGDLVRVGTYSVSTYKKPDDESTIICQRYRDELLNVYYEVESEQGPSYNPLWFRVWQGYVHSAHLQRVKVRLNPVLRSIPEGGQLAEVTVPYSQSLRYARDGRWDSNSYRLYYESTHWIVGIDEGPDGEPWYRLKDELLEVDYHVPAKHLRPVQAEEFAPISPDVPQEKKRIEVSISKQNLIAYENDRVVLETRVSTGIPSHNLPPGEIPTDTPKGSFHVYSKMPSKHMGDGNLTGDPEAYELPGVPWVTFFAENGVALHGTYWHNNYGIQMSHGCVNMRTAEANWIYRWTTPVASSKEWEQRGRGTLVVVS